MPDAPTAPSAHPANALPPGTRLGEFEVLDVLGVGGFGIVYLALDHALEREVAIKEYMPASLAGRTETLHVSVRSPADADTFALGLRSFVNEAKLLARFDHPSLLKVYRFWEANDTAYMSMPVYRGRTLKAVRAAMSAPPDEAWLRALLLPLLGAIETLHGQAVYHRDIAPDNILVEADGRPVLLDFGAARRVIGDHSQALTAILKPAYAPIEQYAEASSLRQGPWTDLYALGATLYFALTGLPPAPSTARTVVDDQLPLATRPVPGCSAAFLQAIDWMLAPRPADRPQNVAALRAVLDGDEAAPSVAPPSPGVDRTRVQAARPATSSPAAASAVSAMAPTMVDRSSQSSQAAAPSGLPAPGPAPSADLPLELPAPPSVQATPAWERHRRTTNVLPVVVALLVAGSASAWWWWPGAPSSEPGPPAASAAASTTGSAAAAASAGPGVDPPRSPSPSPSPSPTRAAELASPADSPRPAPLKAPPPTRPAAQPGEAVPSTASLPATSPLPAPQAVPSAPAPTLPSVPATASAPPTPPAKARAAASVPQSDEPEAICGRRVLLAQVLCMERECRTDEFAKHPACRKWWQQNRNTRP